MLKMLPVLPFRWFLWLLVGWVALVLACNAPLEPEPNLPAPQLVTQTPGGAVLPAGGAATAETTATLEPTLPGEEEIATVELEVTEPLPTFTPISPVEVTVAVVTPSSTQTVLAPTVTRPAGPTRTPAPSATSVSSGPLRFTYTISWRLSPDNPYQAIAHVSITATGGDGNYSYFRDDLPVAGPEFEYQWAACRGNPGSLRVDSAGQSIRTNYFEEPPCPTPTPLP